MPSASHRTPQGLAGSAIIVPEATQPESDLVSTLPLPSPLCSNLSMQLLDTSLQDVKLIRPARHGDERGWFAEVFNAKDLNAAGLPDHFVQDNQSFSRQGVLRGIHYQLGEPQGKLVRVLSGHIWDVAVDLRPGSPQFGQWGGFHLTGDELEFLYIPEGFGHGFLVLSETASVLYKTTGYYYPAGERCIQWDDATLAIAWPLEGLAPPTISGKDATGKPFLEAELPPSYQPHEPLAVTVTS